MTDIYMQKPHQLNDSQETLPCGCVVIRTARSNRTMTYDLVSCNKGIDCSLFKWRKDAKDAEPTPELSKMALFLAKHWLKVPNV